MPVNRNALIRYKTIDNCLRNRYRKWTLESLIDAVSDALYEYEGIDKGVSKRTIQLDLQMMRSDKLGYNAPIVVLDKKYYAYEDPDYSITNIPITDRDIQKLNEVVELLKQFKGFSHFTELTGMVQKLEDKIHTSKTKQDSVIEFEKNDNIKGLDFIETIYQQVIAKHCIELTYKSFNARKASSFIFHPYLLKEYRNRWFVIGSKDKSTHILNLALDRILDIKPLAKLVAEPAVDLKSYYKNVVGLTVNPNEEAEHIKLFFDFQAAPYVITKPIHHSQEIIEKTSHGMIISLYVQHNFELEREILGFGDRVRVIEPSSLVRRIKSVLNDSMEAYDTSLDHLGKRNISQQFQSRGSIQIHRFFTTRFINHCQKIIHLRLTELDLASDSIVPQIFTKVPQLSVLLESFNFKKIVQHLNMNLVLINSFIIQPGFKEYAENFVQENWLETYNIHAESQTNSKCQFLRIRISLDQHNRSSPIMELFPGSHRNRLDPEIIDSIAGNSSPAQIESVPGGIQIYNPLVIHKFSLVPKSKRSRTLVLDLVDRSFLEKGNFPEQFTICQ